MAQVTFRAEVRDAAGNVSVLTATGVVNAPPVITRIDFVPASPWRPQQDVLVTIVASDPEGEALVYALTASLGTFQPRQAGDAPNVFRWRAP